MNDQTLRVELQRVSARYRRLVLWKAMALVWLLLALAVLVAAYGARLSAQFSPALPVIILALLAAGLLATALVARAKIRLAKNPLWIARQIESKFPELDTRLLASLEQLPDQTGELGFLQRMVIDQTLVHAARNGWEQVVPSHKLRLAGFAHLAMLFLFAGVACAYVWEVSQSGSLAGSPPPKAIVLAPYQISVEPADAQVEKGKSLLVEARFDKSRVPGDVHLLLRDDKGVVQDLQMDQPLNDPVFAKLIEAISQDTTYAVRYGDEQTRWYKVAVFEFPALKQADADLKFPAFTGLPEKKIQDTRTITAVEGTKATIRSVST